MRSLPTSSSRAVQRLRRGADPIGADADLLAGESARDLPDDAPQHVVGQLVAALGADRGDVPAERVAEHDDVARRESRVPEQVVLDVLGHGAGAIEDLGPAEPAGDALLGRAGVNSASSALILASRKSRIRSLPGPSGSPNGAERVNRVVVAIQGFLCSAGAIRLAPGFAGWR